MPNCTLETMKDAYRYLGIGSARSLDCGRQNAANGGSAGVSVAYLRMEDV